MNQEEIRHKILEIKKYKENAAEEKKAIDGDWGLIMISTALVIVLGHSIVSAPAITSKELFQYASAMMLDAFTACRAGARLTETISKKTRYECKMEDIKDELRAAGVNVDDEEIYENRKGAHCR